MRKIILYIATSLNGYIAKADGSVDWLENIPNPYGENYGYAELQDSIDVIIQGNTTYKQILEWEIDFPYKGKINYVITNNTNLSQDANVTYISSKHVDFIRNLKAGPGKDIWLIGGGKVNSLLLNNGLIDEIHQFLMPTIIEDGIKLFDTVRDDITLRILDTKIYKSGVVRYRYEVL